MQPITNSLINSLRKATKLLHRDFLELEMLQKNSVRNEEFCKKSYFKLKTLLAEELQKHTTHLFFPEDQFDLNNKYESVFLVNPIDSPSNFARSLPFFAISITYLKQNHGTLAPISTVIYFPVFNEIYYAEKGKGAWVEKNNLNSSHQGLRLRLSDNSDLGKCLIVDEVLKDDDLKKTTIVKSVGFNYKERGAKPIIIGETTSKDVSEFKSFNYNVRSFGSVCYAATLLASGKADLIYLPLLNFTLNYAFELLITEAGGLIVDSTDKFIYSNHYIAKQFKKY